MNRIKNFLSKKIDFFSLLLLFFVLVLLLLFTYLVQTDSKIRHYNDYRKQLQTMSNLNYRLETVFHRKYRYIDYDETMEVTKGFEKCIDKLQHSPMKKEFGVQAYHDFTELSRDYLKKRQNAKKH